jgi:dimethylglycine dehydrogenase
MDLLPPDVDRIADELQVGFERFPALKRVGIKRWVNGAFTFTPDGNPLVGPVPGLKHYWTACGCMAGFSQGGAIGLALARWMIDGDPGADVFGMDVARFPAFAANDAYLQATTRQFYARRFAMTYPNEELPAGRPLRTSPAYEALRAEGARFSVSWGMETPAYFAPGEPGFVETPTLARSNAHALVAAEHKAVREAAGMFDTSVYARYEVSGPGADAFLDRLLACRLPVVGRVKLAPMLKPNGQLMGDLTVSRLADDRFWLVGSYYLQAWHMRWLSSLAPDKGVRIENLSDRIVGFAVSGPRSREIVERLTGGDLGNARLPLFAVREIGVALSRAVVARLSLTGELGYEINVPAAEQRALYHALMEAGRELGLRNIGNRALDTLRLEKSYGIWSAEFTQSATPGSSGLDHHVAFDKPGFIGRDAALKERERGARERLVTLEVDARDADARGFEPVFSGHRRVGHVTSGAYGHHVRKSLAMAYVEADVATQAPPLSVDILGDRRPARIIPRSVYDPEGARIRAAS